MMSFFEQALGPLASLTVRNVASSFIALVWLSLLSMVTIPAYIRLLGVSEWGLVAACASLQILSNFIDAGFSQIVPRWVAQEAHHPVRLRLYVVQFLRMYISLGLLVFMVLQISAGYLSHQWFQVPSHRADDLELAIRIASFQLVFQFLNNLHIGLWNGLQRQVLANIRACGFGTLKHAAALMALALGPAQAWLYVLVFALVAFLELCTNAITVRHMLGKDSAGVTDDTVAMGPLLKEVSVLSGGILVGLLVSQLDRIILSRTVDIESFGIYTVVATLALAFLQLQAPVTRAYFPVIVRDIQNNGHVYGIHIKRLLTGTVLTSTLPALLACAFAPQILAMWLHDSKVVSVGTAPFRLLLFAIALNGLYGCIYQFIIAKGLSRIVLCTNLVSLAGGVLVIFFIGTSKGVVLGGCIWMSTALIQLLFGSAWIIKDRQIFLK